MSGAATCNYLYTPTNSKAHVPERDPISRPLCLLSTLPVPVQPSHFREISRLTAGVSFAGVILLICQTELLSFALQVSDVCPAQSPLYEGPIMNPISMNILSSVLSYGHRRRLPQFSNHLRSLSGLRTRTKGAVSSIRPLSPPLVETVVHQQKCVSCPTATGYRSYGDPLLHQESATIALFLPPIQEQDNPQKPHVLPQGACS